MPSLSFEPIPIDLTAIYSRPEVVQKTFQSVLLSLLNKNEDVVSEATKYVDTRSILMTGVNYPDVDIIINLYDNRIVFTVLGASDEVLAEMDDAAELDIIYEAIEDAAKEAKEKTLKKFKAEPTIPIRKRKLNRPNHNNNAMNLNNAPVVGSKRIKTRKGRKSRKARKTRRA